ncbi:MAG: N-formylglutamate amidohydrolase [Alphaproteobacteria bacterium]|nr:MAG: N-formylglutamate amidohydrolase [Alphaproteobacteria bacterium]
MSAPFDLIGPAGGHVLLIADHASNHIPAEMKRLGLAPHWLDHHIAHDIGTAALVRALAADLGLRAVLAGFSRLVVDANRPEDHESLIPQQSDGVAIPGNADLRPAARQARLERFYRPYHAAIAAQTDAMRAQGETPVLVSLHSFTPVMDGQARPWHCGLLWNRDDRLARQAAELLEARGDLFVGRNQPYSGRILNHTMDTHGEAHGLPYITLEIRQDLIDTPAGIARWQDIVSDLLRRLGLARAETAPILSENLTAAPDIL